ncbi:hypothetical protein F0562_009880 [Nyssa sinensis]|uniref:Protein Iojap, chloroplastic n=1 Tax=Nyssa sinensis TaxID=561372 RepID=A0A5J5A298_9ASTE|nr:hypothetical protein F0562_009880 [Nyssa sinensis]
MDAYSGLVSHSLPCPPFSSLPCLSFSRIHARNRFLGELEHLGHGGLNVSLRTTNLSGSLRGSSTFTRMALGSNVSEDTDDMFDDLFEKYGKVVFKRNDQKPPSAEVDDDAESLSFAVAVAKVASDVKAADIRVLFVKPLVYWTRFFIIATAFSRPQIDAIGTKIKDLAEKQYGKVASGDSKPNSWTLLDFGDVVVHIFLPQQRDLYNLEEFYANATAIELAF